MRVAYCGVLANRDEPAKGGVQSGNRTIVCTLRRKSLEVLEYPFPEPDRYSHRAWKALRYFSGLSMLLGKIAVGARRWNIFHFAGYYHGAFLVYAYLIQSLVRLGGRKFVFHIRAGALLAQYQRGSWLFRRGIDSIIARSDSVAVQGSEFSEFVKARHGSTPLYLPNFVQAKPRVNPECYGMSTTLKLLYLGTVTPTKGVEVALKTKRLVEGHGFEVEMRVIGGGDPEYTAALREQYPDANIHWVGAVEHQQVRDRITGMHFFLFPSRWSGEGHSNALTESMAEGIVPICSDRGFSRRVVGECGRVLPEAAEAEEYAAAVTEIIRSAEWSRLSRMCTERVKERYCADTVIDDLLRLYESL